METFNRTRGGAPLKYRNVTGALQKMQISVNCSPRATLLSIAAVFCASPDGRGICRYRVAAARSRIVASEDTSMYGTCRSY